jgi:phage gp29-like protein
VLQTRGGGDLKIYQELLRDDQVISTFQQRRTAVTSAEWEVTPASESAQDKQAAEFIKEQLERVKFDALTDKMLYAIFYGYGVAEWLFAADGNRITLRGCKVRDRSRFRFGTDGRLYLITTQDPMGKEVDRAKFWTLTTGAEHDDQPYGMGLAHYLYWPVFFKRNGLKYWAVFLEKFGQPTPMARLPQGQMNDPALKRKALEALQAIQVDSGVLIPDGIVIELLEAARSGTADYQALQQPQPGRGSRRGTRRSHQGRCRPDLRKPQRRHHPLPNRAQLPERAATEGMAQHRTRGGSAAARGNRQGHPRAGV